MTATALPPTLPETSVGLAGKLFNPTNFRREEWCPIAVPYQDGKKLSVESTFQTDRGLKLRAVKCEDVGTHSTMFRVYAPFGPQQDIGGKLVTLGTEKPASFVYHPWTTDQPKRLVPAIAVRIDGVDHWCRKFDLLEIESGHGSNNGQTQHPCYQRWHFRGKCGNSGFLVEGWVTFYHLSPVADVRVGIVWSDRNDPSHDKWIEGILFETGEYTKFDFGLRNGQLAVPVHNGNGWINAVIGSGGTNRKSLGFVDGSGIPLMGRMLCLPQDPAWLPENFDPESEIGEQLQEDLMTLHAANEMPVYGVCERSVWDGKWLAHGNVANIYRTTQQIEADAESIWQGFLPRLDRFAGFYAPRPIGTTEGPAVTGDQEDFNATKGWPAVNAGDARWIHFAMYSVVADYFRGYMHYENGLPLDPSKHQNWTTWSGYTHWHKNLSPDRLGKADMPWGARLATGWIGYDDQHRSQNNLAAVYALTGDPILKFIIDHMSTSDIANVRYKRAFGIGAPRAVGRLALCWSHFLRLTDVASPIHWRFRTLLDDKIRMFKAKWKGDEVAGPVDILVAGLDNRHGITWEGQAVPSWVVWEHGLLLQGAYAAWKVTGDDQWLHVVQRVSRTILKYGTFKDTFDGWWFCNNVHWSSLGQSPLNLSEGEPMPRKHYTKASTLVNFARGGVADWTFPAMLMFIETADENDPDLAQAREIVAQFTKNADSDDARTAEWWACTGAVVPTPGDHMKYNFDALRPDFASA